MSKRKVSLRVIVPAAAVFAVLLFAAGAHAAPRQTAGPLGQSVLNFGAVGNGRHDDTTAFQAAMSAVSRAGGGRVYIPAGNYRISGTITVPQDVTLAGTWAAPPTYTDSSATAPVHGTTLWAYSGKGDANGTPFITLQRNSALRGIAIFYPEQTRPVPVAYPWCIRGNGDNCSLVNVLLVNPYQGVDFGTLPCGRHFINGLYGEPLYKGLYIDQCFDIGRVDNVHFWPFWDVNPSTMTWTSQHGTAFIIGRTDWEYMRNCFTIAYHVGYHFINGKAGPGNVVLTQCGADEGADGTTTTPVIVDNSESHAGISFVNGQFMGTTAIDVRASNTGPIKFTACGLWGMPNCDTMAKLAGTGTVTFTACHFITWAKISPTAPAIDANCDGITITGCDFMDAGHTQVSVGPLCKSAIIAENRLRGGQHINLAPGVAAQIGLNTTR